MHSARYGDSVYSFPYKLTFEEVGDEEAMVNADVVLVALAVLELGEKRKPVWGGEVHCFCDIEPEVEALVIGRREGDDELPGTLHLSGKVTCGPRWSGCRP